MNPRFGKAYVLLLIVAAAGIAISLDARSKLIAQGYFDHGHSFRELWRDALDKNSLVSQMIYGAGYSIVCLAILTLVTVLQIRKRKSGNWWE